jgi:hypothetical protein
MDFCHLLVMASFYHAAEKKQKANGLLLRFLVFSAIMYITAPPGAVPERHVDHRGGVGA